MEIWNEELKRRIAIKYWNKEEGDRNADDAGRGFYPQKRAAA